MSASRAEIFEKLQRIGKSQMHCYVGTFVSYNKDNSTITVELPSGLKIPGVRLKGSVNRAKGYYNIQIPREKSTVLIGLIGDKAEAGEYYLIMCDEIETIEIKADKTKFVLDKTGVSFENHTSAKFKQKANGKYFIKSTSFNLYDVMEELISELRNGSVQVLGNAGPNPLTVTYAKFNTATNIKLESVWAKLSDILTNQE